MNPSDAQAVAAQLGREPRRPWRVTARCDEGAPKVIAVAPTLEDGSPFPTTFWLTCPRIVDAVRAMESRGVHRDWTVRIAADVSLRTRMLVADAAYRAARLEEGADDRLASVGVAGQRDPLAVKCLHARVAAYLSGIDDPIGEATAREISVEAPCVLRDRCRGAREACSSDVSDER